MNQHTISRRSVLSGAGASLMMGLLPWESRAKSSNAPNLLGYLRTNWSRDPFSLGSYSHIAKGSWRRHHRHLSQPIANKLYFAGEAANPDRNTSVHAALESGRRVANLILAQKHQRIGIIGAGISGLCAAHILRTAGRKVHVIEARNRIGGRINTNRSLGFAADLGASWLHWANGNPLVEEIDKAQMQRVASSTESHIIMRNGHPLPPSEAPDWLEDVNIYNNDAATSAGSLNIWAYLLTSEYSGTEYLFPNGYDQILNNYRGDYAISLRDVVSAIDYTDKGVSITSTKGKSHFDSVIATVPLGVLKANRIRFSPPLPTRHQTAVNKLGFGTLDKVYLQFDDVFWDRDIQHISTPFNGLPQGHFNSWLNLYPVIKKPVILCFNGGPNALELAARSDKSIVKAAQKTILGAHGFET